MNFKKNLLLIFLLGVVLAGCSQIEVSKEAPEINDLRPSEKFTIILPEDHRDGSNWQLMGDYDSTLVERLNEVWHGNDKGIYFNLKTLREGQCTLQFVKRKYTDTLDNKHFIIKIAKK